VFASFAGLFQGDRLGVEQNARRSRMSSKMLEEAGCHPAHNRLTANQPILQNKPILGLVIDDFSLLSAEDRSGARGDVFHASSASSQFLDRAKPTYREQRVYGSDDKEEVRGSLLFKVIWC